MIDKFNESAVEMESGCSRFQFNLDINGAKLNVFSNNPSLYEINLYRKDEVQFALFVHNEVAYFLTKFGSEEWVECPFHASINSVKSRGIPVGFVAGKHNLPVAVILCDEYKVQKSGGRFVTLGKKMSEMLIDVALMQLNKAISIREYELRIERTYKKYSASEMAAMAVVKCIGGKDDVDTSEEGVTPNAQENISKKYLQVKAFSHISLHSGHVCTQPWTDISQQSMRACRDLIIDSRETGWTRMILDKKIYPVYIHLDGSNLLGKLYLPSKNIKSDHPAVVFAVAAVAENGEQLWRKLHEWSGQLALTNPDCKPTVPWVAAMPMPPRDMGMPSLLEYLELMTWVGDFERVMAFSFSSYFYSKDNI